MRQLSEECGARRVETQHSFAKVIAEDQQQRYGTDSLHCLQIISCVCRRYSENGGEQNDAACLTLGLVLQQPGVEANPNS